jgi:hypothetical protein
MERGMTNNLKMLPSIVSKGCSILKFKTRKGEKNEEG